MSSWQRRCHRGLWLLLAPAVFALLGLAVRWPADVPANTDWPSVVPLERG